MRKIRISSTIARGHSGGGNISEKNVYFLEYSTGGKYRKYQHIDYKDTKKEVIDSIPNSMKEYLIT